MKKVKLLVFLVLSLCFSVFIAFAEEANAADMHRLYNPNSGEHFYTANGNEKNHLVKIGWKYEGIGWTAPATGNAVYRLYNANAGDHHYTQNVNEKNHLVKVGWKYEGIGWYSDVKKTIPLYRAYNPNAKAGSHNYTVNYAEQKNLIRVGWRDEGIAWYGIRKSTPVTKYTVTVKHVGSDGKTLKTSTASVEKGKSYIAKAGSFSGYTLKGSNSQTVTVNGNKTITFNYTKNVAPVTKYTVTVKHVGSDGKELKKTTATIEKGKNYTAKAETFSGYTLKGNNSQTVTVNGNKTITFNYTKNAVSTPKYTVTVVHKDIKGKELAGATKATVEEGESYTAKAVKVNGYTVTGADSKTVKIYGNTILTFTYLKNDSDYYTITVKFVDETGQNIRPASKQLVEKGDSYVANAKEIPDYTVKGNDTQTISSVNKDETLTFVYTKNTAPMIYKVTVKHMGSDGKTLKTTTDNVENGKSYTANAESFTGYTQPRDKTQKVTVTKDMTLTFTYTVNKYNVTVVHKGSNGKILETEKAVSVEYDKEHTAKSKTFTGYTLSGNNTQKVTVKGTTTLTFTYNPIKYNVTVIHKGSDGKILETEKAVSVEYDKEHIANAKVFTGYTLSGNKIQKITVKGATTLTFNYTKNVENYNVTVVHKSSDGKILETEKAVPVGSGKSHTANSKTFVGYTLSGNKTQTVTVTGNMTITFIYTLNDYTVTVNHKGNDGKNLKTETATIKYGKVYTATAKSFYGYTLSGNNTKVVTVDGNMTLTFNYNLNQYTITIIHQADDGTILEEETATVQHGENYTARSKLFTGYLAVYNSLTAIKVSSNKTMTLDYSKIVPLPESELTIMKQTILAKVNELRRSLNLSEFKQDAKLNVAVNIRANELMEKYDPNHLRPDGSSCFTVLGEVGVSYKGAAENIAWSQSRETSGKILGEKMYQSWFDSPGHKKNMVDPSLQYIGIGVSSDGEKVYGAQLFISR